MADVPKPETGPTQPTVFEIRIKGHLDRQWADWFGGLAITLEEDGHTRLTGPVADQAALFGLLKRVRDLGMPLVSVNRTEACPERSRGAGKPEMSSTSSVRRRNEMDEKAQFTVDPNGKRIYRIGGIAAFILVLGYFATFALYASAGIEPTGAEARLIHFAPHLTEWWAILGLMVFTDLLYIPVWLALYRALKGISRNVMVLALVCNGLFVVLDLAVTWTNYAALFNLSRDYAMAANDIQRAAIVSSAGAAAAVANSLMLKVIAILTPSLGTLLSGFVMRKGIFSKGAAYLSFAVGITGILAAFGPIFTDALGAMHIINALLATVWYVLVGWRLYKLGQ